MIRITPNIAIPEDALSERFVRSPGPGGQNVNKVATAVELRFDAAGARLTPAVRARLKRLAGRRMTAAGELILTAHRHRTQEANRREARARLIDLLRRAAAVPKRRRPTRPTAAAKERRIQAKKQRGQKKAARRAPEA